MDGTCLEQSPDAAQWRLVMGREHAQPATGDISAPARCGGNPLVFSCFAVERSFFCLKVWCVVVFFFFFPTPSIFITG